MKSEEHAKKGNEEIIKGTGDISDNIKENPKRFQGIPRDKYIRGKMITREDVASQESEVNAVWSHRRWARFFMSNEYFPLFLPWIKT